MGKVVFDFFEVDIEGIFFIFFMVFNGVVFFLYIWIFINRIKVKVSNY